jgi:ATP-binding cassette subfamily C (CFTR/MRP) protein 1
LHAIWYSLLQISLALYFLFQQLGASCLGGVCIIVIMIPVTKYIAQWMGKMQKKLMKAKDKRVELNSEVLSGMKVIKFQAWEESFQDRILSLRETELEQLLRYFVGSTISRMLWVATPLLVALSTFATYVWSGHKLDVASALTALALFDILRFPLFMLPQSTLSYRKTMNPCMLLSMRISPDTCSSLFDSQLLTAASRRRSPSIEFGLSYYPTNINL